MCLYVFSSLTINPPELFYFLAINLLQNVYDFLRGRRAEW